MAALQNTDGRPETKSTETRVPWLITVGAAIGIAFAGLALPFLVPTLESTLLGSSPKAYWYLSRATALVALALLWLSVVLGLLISDKMAKGWPGSPLAFALHEFSSLLGLGFAAFHGMILLGDRYIAFRLSQIIVPFSASGYRPFWVGLGQVAFYMWAVVCASFYVRRAIGQRTWRVIHFATFFCFVSAVMHGLAAGTDTGSASAQTVYWIFGGSVLFLTVYRVLAGMLVAGRTSQA